LNRDEVLHARDRLGIRLGFHREGTRPTTVIVEVVMIGIVRITMVVRDVVVCDVVPTQVRVYPAGAVMPLVMVVRVRMHQRGAERAEREHHR
jgi:hypothetical protein